MPQRSPWRTSPEIGRALQHALDQYQVVVRLVTEGTLQPGEHTEARIEAEAAADGLITTHDRFQTATLAMDQLIAQWPR